MRPMIEAVEPRTLMAAQPPQITELIHLAAATKAVVVSAKATITKNVLTLTADSKGLGFSAAQEAPLKALPKSLTSKSTALTSKITSTSSKLVSTYRKALADSATYQRHATSANKLRLEKDVVKLESTARAESSALLAQYNTFTQTVDKGLLAVAALKSGDATLQQHVQDALAAQNQSSTDFTTAAHDWLITVD